MLRFLGNIFLALVTMNVVCWIDPGAHGPFDRALLLAACASMFHAGSLVVQGKSC